MVGSSSAIGAATYQVNALGERVQKTSALGNTVFHYDRDGHLIADAVKWVAANAPPNTATWTMPAGEYEVFARWTAHPNRATDAKYTVVHAGGATPITVNQQAGSGQWNSLGTYTFTAGGAIKLTDQANGYVIADAIKVVPTPGQGGTGGTPALYYVYPDHLGTPRVVANAANQPVWRWDNVEPFGDTPPEENPSGLGAFEFPLRFPGQYQDRETGLSYNYFRDYDAATGRYVQSDPIGLAGGLNSFAYVGANPLGGADSRGLIGWRGTASNISVIYGGGATRLAFDLVSDCVNGRRAKITVVAGGTSVGFGVAASITDSNIDFEDGLSAIDPYVFEGEALFSGIGFALGFRIPAAPPRFRYQGGGLSAIAVQLGRVRTFTGGPQWGIDFSVYGGAGISQVDTVEWEQCCDK